MAVEPTMNMTGTSSGPVTATETTAPVAPAEVKAEPKQDDDVSRRFAALSRQQRKLYEEQERFKKEAKEWQEWKQLKDSAKQKPIDYLKAGGLSPDDLVQHLLQEGEPASIEKQVKQLQAQIEQDRLEKQQAEQARLEAEKATRESAAIDSYKQKIREYIGQDTSKYEAINALQVQDLVWDKIQAGYNETGELMPISKAADLLESEILEGAKKLLNLKKLAPQEPEKLSVPSPKASPLAQTLTNNLSQPLPRSPARQSMSREESLKAAARMLQWKD